MNRDRTSQVRQTGGLALADAPDAFAERPPVIVRSRHTEVTPRLRAHVSEKVAHAGRLTTGTIRFDVEISREHNPRQSQICERVEITCFGRGPVVRAEAAARDVYSALDLALGKLEERLRRAADRKHCRGQRIAHLVPAPVDAPAAGRVGAGARPAAVPEPPAAAAPDPGADPGTAGQSAADPVIEGDAAGPFMVREKSHPTTPMSLDDALANMELVGHDFYLFHDSACGEVSVVYRRRGYHYGVLRLRDGAGAVPTGGAPDAG